MITTITASFVLGVAAAGVAALPWREEELAQSSSAWFGLVAWVVGARRVEDVFAAGDADALLPASLPRSLRQTSSGYATASKSRASSGRSSNAVRAWGPA